VDAADPAHAAQIEAVEGILHSLERARTPRLLVWNKADKLSPEAIDELLRENGGVAISAAKREGLDVLLEKAERTLFAETASEELAALRA
jgi:GTP-binding protein HflX